MDSRLAAELEARDGSDGAFVDAIYRLVLRREPDLEARDRSVAKLAEGTLSRATLIHELVSSDEHGRVRELDDAVALGLGARARGVRLSWLQVPPADERVIEIPWVLSRLGTGRVLEVGYAHAERAYLAGLIGAGVELVGVDLTFAEVVGMETVEADVRELPFADRSFDQVLLVSTLEHVGADNTMYGIASELDTTGPTAALRELRRILRPNGTLLLTVPLGEPGDHQWFRQDDVRGWTGLYATTGWFIEDIEAYELDARGWCAAPSFDPTGVRYGERGPAASAVLCAELSPGRMRHLLTPGGMRKTARRRAVHTYRRLRPRDL